MFSASLYIIVCSARNRTWQRLRRLREPRYLLGAIAGTVYLAFTLFIRQRAYQATEAPAPGDDGSGFMLVGPVIVGVILAVAALGSWLLPFGSGLLDLSKAETALLLPAPMTRRHVVIYRLMRSQFAVFTGALIMALAYPTGSLFGRLRGLVGVWLLLMTSHVFFTIVTLARGRVARRDSSIRFGWPALALPGGAVLAVVLPLVAEARQSPLQTTSAALDAIARIAQHGTARLLVWPFTSIARPLFAHDVGAFGHALLLAVPTYVLAVAWLLWADARSPDAADAAVERQVSLPTVKARTYVAREVAWQLAPSGPPEIAFVWKCVLQTFRTVDRRVILRVAIIVGWLIAASLFATRALGVVALLGVGSTWGALFALFMAPQMVRMDLREDLAHLELLKTWPIRGAALVRGEIVWPAAVVTAITWAFGVLAMVLSMISVSRVPAGNRVAAWASFLILVPAVVLAQYAMHNTVAVLFPGWVPLGTSRPRGVDAVGQRLILLAANWMGLIVALLPGIVLTVLLSLVFRPIVGPVILPVGALLTTMIVVAEVWLVTEWLGPVYERLDVTSVERPD